jgi:hypothetical protein
MADDRLAEVIRPIVPDASRRRLLNVLAAGPLALWPWAGLDIAAAKRKRRKRKKRKKQGQQESCAESCHQSCARCYHRPDGVPLCGSQGGTFCNYPCVDDNDCVGTGHPYCTSGQTHFATGTTQLWDCPSGFASFCTDVAAC